MLWTFSVIEKQIIIWYEIVKNTYILLLLIIILIIETDKYNTVEFNDDFNNV